MRTEHIVIESHNRHITAREIEDRFFSVLQEADTAWAKLPQESEVRPLPAFLVLDCVQ